MALPTGTLDSLTAPDLVVVPGSGNPMLALTDKTLLAWVRHVSQHATWMASVCTGASIYAAAGILAGRRHERCESLTGTAGTVCGTGGA